MAATTEVATRTPTQRLITQIRSDEFREQVGLALPAHIRPERFIRATVTAIIQNPEVAIYPESLFQAAIKAAQDGLLPDGREAAFVVFKQDGEKKVVYLPMVGGFRKIAAKHGFTLVADVVHAGDYFSWSKVPFRLEHVPELETAKQGEIICAYAVAFERGGYYVTAPQVMNVTEIEKVRAVSRMRDAGPWRDWWERMAAKTVARRLFHELPLTDLEEVETRIVEQADVDAELPELGLSAAEADVAARFAGALPPDDGPDDRGDPDRSRSAEAFTAAVARLTALDAETDWLATAEREAAHTHDAPLAALADAELDAITRQMEETADSLEPKGRP